MYFISKCTFRNRLYRCMPKDEKVKKNQLFRLWLVEILEIAREGLLLFSNWGGGGAAYGHRNAGITDLTGNKGLAFSGD